jgi:hypothetical protein
VHEQEFQSRGAPNDGGDLLLHGLDVDLLGGVGFGDGLLVRVHVEDPALERLARVDRGNDQHHRLDHALLQPLRNLRQHALDERRQRLVGGDHEAEPVLLHGLEGVRVVDA